MPLSKLRVRARSGIVSRFDLVDHGIKRMVGHTFQKHDDAPNGFAWVPTNETEEVPNLPEFRTALKDDALWAADEATAREIWGAQWREHFDASFGTAPKRALAPASTADAKDEVKQ